MKQIQSIFTGFLLSSFGVACSGHASYQPMLPDVIKKDYLRDMDTHPLNQGEGGEETNQETGKCNNFNHRFKKSGLEGKNRIYGEVYPIYLMQHHTVADFQRTTHLFTKGKSPVSAHYVIDKDGGIYYFVKDSYRAYHAGAGSLAEGSRLSSFLSSEVLSNDMNSWSIGIENVNNGNESYTEAQIKSNVELCSKLADQHKTINPALMLGHSDWAPGRKIDPNPYFPWDKFANAQDESSFNGLDINKNFGIYPRKRDLTISSDPDIIVSY